MVVPYREAARERKQALDEAKLKERLTPVAQRRVALALILSKLIETHNLSLNPTRVRAAVEELAQSYEDSEAVIRWYYGEKERLQEIENMVMEDQVVDLVLEKAKTDEEHVGFHELVQAAASPSLPGHA